MRVIEITTPGVIKLSKADTPSPVRNQILIRVKASGICGTDVHIAGGGYLGAYPVIPGHEFSGDVIAVGDEVSRFKSGDRVAVEPNLACGNCEYCLQARFNHCLNWQAIGVTLPGGMAEYVLVPEDNVFNIHNLDYEIAAFMEPLSCILHGFAKLVSNPSAAVLVMGAGPIGVMFAQVLKHAGFNNMRILERQTGRAALAGKLLGLGADSSSSNYSAEQFDLIVDATGSITLMEMALNLVRKGGEILYFGVPPRQQNLAIDPFQLFEKGLTLHTSYTSVNNSRAALKLLSQGRVIVDELISHRLVLEEFKPGIDLIVQGQSGVNKIMIYPQIA